MMHGMLFVSHTHTHTSEYVFKSTKLNSHKVGGYGLAMELSVKSLKDSKREENAYFFNFGDLFCLIKSLLVCRQLEPILIVG